MIELLVAERCTACNICVEICPTNVFERREGTVPAIARQTDCQSCFMCELYCPEDALFVAPQTDALSGLDPAHLIADGQLGRYRRSIGWTKETRDLRSTDASFHLLSQLR